jgi:hypothetical protein
LVARLFLRNSAGSIRRAHAFASVMMICQAAALNVSEA